MSLTDITYWQRYQNSKVTHELTRNKLSVITPFSRLPEGKSIFELNAIQFKLLSVIRDHLETIRHERPGDMRGHLLPLLVLHRQIGVNYKGKKYPTALHVAID